MVPFYGYALEDLLVIGLAIWDSYYVATSPFLLFINFMSGRLSQLGFIT